MELRDQIQTALGDAFTVERELGGGGMSRVFVAVDTGLERRIVIKVLPPDAMAHVSVERFKREIKVAARLQHPHIVPLLSAGDMDGVPWFTMPFVQGESLRERLSRPLVVAEAIHVLRDVASALAYAHGMGIVHRDIKPDNIILSGGVAVVADFGVAKAFDLAATSVDEGRSALTSMGIALGTPAYMAPEQAAADPDVDHRADIYSFGCVAYEMLAGEPPFSGRPLAQILAAHVQEKPIPIATRHAGLPDALAELVMRCLEKRPEDRPQTAAGLLTTLDAIGTSGRSVSRQRRMLIAASAVVLVAAAVGAWTVRNGGMQVVKAGQVTSIATTNALELDPVISPDGKNVAYVAGGPGSYHVLVRQLAGERAIALVQEFSGEQLRPAWSHDGSLIAFITNGVAYSVPSSGGAPKVLVETPGLAISEVAWSPDGERIAFVNTMGLWIKPAGADAPVQLLPGQTLHSIAWSPDGTRIAFIDGIAAGLENMSSAPIYVITIAGGKVVVIAKGDVVNLSPVWTPDGRSLLYTSNRQGTLDIYQQFLTSDAQPSGLAQRITVGLSARRISLSKDGSHVAYDVVRNRSNIWTVDIGSGVASMTAARQVTSDNQRIESLSLSHDGQWLAYDSDLGGNPDIYKVKVNGGDPVRLTTNLGGDFFPAWSPDDRQILFHSSRTGNRELFSMSADGTGEQQLTTEKMELYAPQLSPDGRHLYAYVGSGAGAGRPRYDVVFDKDSAGRWTNMRRITPDHPSFWFRLSQDGQWIAYVTALPDAPPGDWTSAMAMRSGGRDDHVVLDMLPAERATYVAFGKDAGTLFVMTRRAADRRYGVYSVPLAGGAPRLLLRDDAGHRISRWDFATDGRRLFFTLAADESDVYLMALSH